MRFLWRNAIFILFPAVLVAIVFLGIVLIESATRFGERGERSLYESAIILTKEKIERVEITIRATDDLFFTAISPEHLDLSCERWRKTISSNNLVSSAAVLDDQDNMVGYYYREPFDPRVREDLKLFEKEILPLIDKYDSYNQYKHIHRTVQDKSIFITHFTRFYGDDDYVTVLIYDPQAVNENLLEGIIENVGEERVASIVDDRNQSVVGRAIGTSEELIVARRFPSTFYKWRLQLAPTAQALAHSRAQERAKAFSRALLIPLALFVIALSLAVLYLSIVRERRINRLKSEFVANVTHELKTPLSLIRMFGELLTLGKVEDPDKARQYCEIIVRETDRLTSLIDNVLNLAKIERGKNAYEFAESSVKQAVEHGIEITRHSLEKQSLSLTYRAEGKLDRVMMDDRAITLAVVNLIDNAVKYATGTSTIGVEVFGDDRQIRIDVYDQGAGIPTGQIKRIFERFYRVPCAETQKQRGSGIGLSLVRHIAEGHGGEVLVTSDPGIETRFSIRFPAVRG